jgi:hypothetical protein
MKQVDPYEELNVNAYGVLKPPLLLWMIMLIETWHLWSFFLITASGETWLFTKGLGWVAFAVEVPALIVWLVLSRRVPKAKKFVRALWYRGRELLTLSAVGNIGLIVAGLIQANFWHLRSEWVAVGVALLHIWVLARLWITPIIRQVFSEFPD